MSGTPIKLTYKRTTKNPGAARFDQVYSKRNPKPVRDLSDRDLLVIVLGNPKAAESVIEHVGTLSSFSIIGDGAALLSRPGISKGIAIKLDALFELAVRIG